MTSWRVWVLSILCCGIVESAAGMTIIQELRYRGPGSDSNEVFTELLGVPGSGLDGFTLIGINGASAEIYRSIDLGGLVFPADGLLVIATAAADFVLAAVRDLVANVDWQNGPGDANNCSIRLATSSMPCNTRAPLRPGFLVKGVPRRPPTISSA